MAGDKEPTSRWLVGSVVVPLLAAAIGAGIWVNNRDGGNGKANTGDTATTATPAPTTASAPPIAVPPAKGGAEVRACMAQHQMSRAVSTSTTLVEARGTLPGELPETAQPDPVTIFQRCDWPPKPWSHGDGYSEISVQYTIGPGEGEVSDANTADIIRSDCKLLEVEYSIAAQGYQERLPVLRSKPYRVVYYFGKEYRDSLELSYDVDELVVLRNSKVRLDRVHCVQ